MAKGAKASTTSTISSSRVLDPGPLRHPKPEESHRGQEGAGGRKRQEKRQGEEEETED